MNALMAIQTELKAPKNQRNTFGNYNYRSCEDILEAVKPLLAKHHAALTLSDEVVEIGGHVFIKATASLFDADSKGPVSVTALARHPETKKGMDDSQITGATSSYARKYALNGLFCIDDNKDADATNDHGKGGSGNPGASGAGNAPAGNGTRPKSQGGNGGAPQGNSGAPMDDPNVAMLTFMKSLGVEAEELEQAIGGSVKTFTEADRTLIRNAATTMRQTKCDFHTAITQIQK